MESPNEHPDWCNPESRARGDYIYASACRTATVGFGHRLVCGRAAAAPGRTARPHRSCSPRTGRDSIICAPRISPWPTSAHSDCPRQPLADSSTLRLLLLPLLRFARLAHGASFQVLPVAAADERRMSWLEVSATDQQRQDAAERPCDLQTLAGS